MLDLAAHVGWMLTSYMARTQHATWPQHAHLDLHLGNLEDGLLPQQFLKTELNPNVQPYLQQMGPKFTKIKTVPF